MKVQQFSQYLDKLEHTDSRNDITATLAKMFDQAELGEIDKLVYLCLGRVAPLYQSLEFNIAEKMMVKILAQAFSKPEDEINRIFKDKGDLGDVAFQLSQEKNSKDLTISQIYKKLKTIAKQEGSGSQKRKTNLFVNLLNQLDPLSSKYVVRITLGNLRLGFSDVTVLDALSWMKKKDKSLRAPLEKAFNVRADIGQIAKQFKKKRIEIIKQIKPQTGIPIRPSLTERLDTPEEILNKIDQPVAEPKYDGFRLQIHWNKNKKQDNGHPLLPNKSQGKVTIFSRQMEDMTNMFPDVVKEIKRLNIDSLILDGEIIAVDKDSGEFLPFQETVQRKRKYNIKEAVNKIPIKVFIFDLLYLNGKSLLTETFKQRRQKLEKLFNNIPKNSLLKLTKQKKISNEKDLTQFFDNCVNKKLEGIVVKKTNSEYQAGARGFHWVKYKKAMQSELADSVDCLVLGYYRGKGKRSEFGIGAFLTGVYDHNQDQFLTISKIGTGLSDEQWKELKQKADQYKVDNKSKQYQIPKELNCDVWLEPNLVVEIEADEITKSPLHTSKYALRFPRMKRFRDKQPTDTTTVKEIIKMYKETK
jgi:DNA ligase-1